MCNLITSYLSHEWSLSLINYATWQELRPSHCNSEETNRKQKNCTRGLNIVELKKFLPLITSQLKILKRKVQHLRHFIEKPIRKINREYKEFD